MAECLNCGNKFEAKRSTAKYCSAKCRKLAFLSVPAEEDSGTLPENAKPIDVTLKNGKLDADIPDFETDLPDCVPFPVVNRYKRGELDYVKVIDRLLSHTLDELTAKGIWIPCWRYIAGQEALI